MQLYLSQYGYLSPSRGNSSQLLDERSYKKAIEDFQAFAGLDVTGKDLFLYLVSVHVILINYIPNLFSAQWNWVVSISFTVTDDCQHFNELLGN